MKLLIDGALIGLGLTIADWYPRFGQLGVLLILIGLSLGVGIFFWNRRP
jgi:hypothetical protein